jgi:uncharacterized membrane protein required for colicin V production
MGIDSFINAVVPWAIGIFFAYLLYKPLATPLSELFGWFRGIIDSIRGKFSKEDGDEGFNFTGEKEIQFE